MKLAHTPIIGQGSRSVTFVRILYFTSPIFPLHMKRLVKHEHHMKKPATPNPTLPLLHLLKIVYGCNPFFLQQIVNRLFQKTVWSGAGLLLACWSTHPWTPGYLVGGEIWCRFNQQKGLEFHWVYLFAGREGPAMPVGIKAKKEAFHCFAREYHNWPLSSWSIILRLNDMVAGEKSLRCSVKYSGLGSWVQCSAWIWSMSWKG